jgi:hypothetical protein
LSRTTNSSADSFGAAALCDVSRLQPLDTAMTAAIAAASRTEFRIIFP